MNLSGAQRIALRRAARNSQYHLLLGAGFSMDSRNKSGVALPSSSGLIEQIAASFGVEVEEGDLLWRIYDRAVDQSSEEAVYRFFRENFWGVTPPYWMDYYARGPWSTVWTLNVDDSFEASFARVRSDTSRQMRSVNWDSDYREGREMNVVHLHGMADRDEPRRLVFSLREYAGSAATEAAWPVNFRDSYGNSPFVIVGARLRDEPDVEAVIRGRRPTSEAPSLYVARSISAATKRDLQRWGLVPIEMTAEDFILEWAEMTGLSLEEGLSSDIELGMRIGKQFVELREDSKIVVEFGHDFFGGDEPTWSDIRLDYPAELEWVQRAFTDVDAVGKSLNSCIAISHTGRRLTGKSTGLLMVAHRLRRSAWRTFFFRDTGRIDVEAILQFGADSRSIALLFDGMADVADDVDRLITEARKAGLNVICVGVDNEDREPSLVGRIHSANLAYSRVASINGRLTTVDSARVVDRLDKFGRLGILEPETDARRVSHFRGSDLFDSLAQLSNAPGFGRRVGDLLVNLEDPRVRNLVLISAYSSFVDHRLLVIDAARMVGLTSDDLVRAVRNDPSCSALLLTDGNVVRTRHRWLALSPLVKSLGSDVAATVVRNAVEAVSSRVNRASLRERNPTALLIGAFMAHRNLRNAFPNANLDEWYASLLHIFGEWNGRYWEQRAILARRSGDVSQLAKAESFALRAAEMVPDSFSLTTLGTVLLERAARSAVDVEQYYDRAWKTFERASGFDASSNSIITWIAYLRFSIKVVERLLGMARRAPEDATSARVLSKVVADWERIYVQSAIFSDVGEKMSADLRRLRPEFDRLRSEVHT